MQSNKDRLDLSASLLVPYELYGPCTDRVDNYRLEKLTDRNLTFTDRYSAGVLDNPRLIAGKSLADNFISRILYRVVRKLYKQIKSDMFVANFTRFAFAVFHFL